MVELRRDYVHRETVHVLSPHSKMKSGVPENGKGGGGGGGGGGEGSFIYY